MGAEIAIRFPGEIYTERLHLRPVSPGDAPRIRRLAGDLAVARWLSRVPHPYPEGEAERFIEACIDEAARAWAVERRSEPGLIGIIGIDGPAGRENLGYWLGAPLGPGICLRGSARRHGMGIRERRREAPGIGRIRGQRRLAPHPGEARLLRDRATHGAMPLPAD